MTTHEFDRIRRMVFHALAEGKPIKRLLTNVARTLSNEEWNKLSAEIDAWFAAQGIQ